MYTDERPDNVEAEMGIEQHKQVASEFFARVTANDVSGAVGLLTDDVSWWLAGKPALLPVAGAHNKERIARILGNMVAPLKNGLTLTVKSAIAEGDKVALEVVSHGELANGRTYDNEHCIVMTIRGGKIAVVREYYDTQHTFATWFQQ
ncbi:MAG TPA: nuclear transport factor 2 family protein [Polyangiaceae bacterium]